MTQLNALPSTNTAPAATANTQSAACKNCSGGHRAADNSPSFADLLENVEENSVLTNEQREQLNEQSAKTAQSPIASGPELASASILAALAANDSTGSEPTGSAGKLEEGADSVVELLSELNGNLVNQAGSSNASASFGDTLAALGENAGSQPVSGASSAQNLQAAQAGVIAQDNQAGAIANTVGSPSSQPLIAPVGESAGNITNAQQVAQNNAVAGGEARQGPSPDLNELTARIETLVGQINSDPKNTSATIEQTQAIANSPIEPATKDAALTPALIKTALETTAAKPLQAAAGGSASASALATTEDTDASSSTSQEQGASAQKDAQTLSSSLMQRLKPLQQASPQFAPLEGAAQNTLASIEGGVPAIGTSAIGDLSRPAGIPGLAPTNNTGAPQVPLNNIAVHIAAQANAGNQRFNIRLDPPELGRIDIRLEIGRDGQTFTHLTVEKSETLDLLRQDSRQLERALTNAGLDSREGALSFSLREENQNKQQADDSDQEDGQSPNTITATQDEVANPLIERTLNVTSGLDISI